jgi:hypothetical protein
MMREVEPGAIYSAQIFTTEFDTTEVLDQDTYNTV